MRISLPRSSPSAFHTPRTRRWGRGSIAATALAALTIASCATNVAQEKIAELERLPTGLTVQHTPNPAHWREYAQPSRRYTWSYQSTVTATGGEWVTITEFGAFSWSGNRWVGPTTFTSQDFARSYQCPSAKVDPGRPCTDLKNWTSGDALQPGHRVRWYYIGVNADGQRVKGEAIIHLAQD